jgi:hypothetical protein
MGRLKRPTLGGRCPFGRSAAAARWHVGERRGRAARRKEGRGDALQNRPAAYAKSLRPFLSGDFARHPRSFGCCRWNVAEGTVSAELSGRVLSVEGSREVPPRKRASVRLTMLGCEDPRQMAAAPGWRGWSDPSRRGTRAALVMMPRRCHDYCDSPSENRCHAPGSAVSTNPEVLPALGSSSSACRRSRS